MNETETGGRILVLMSKDVETFSLPPQKFVSRVLLKPKAFEDQRNDERLVKLIKRS